MADHISLTSDQRVNIAKRYAESLRHFADSSYRFSSGLSLEPGTQREAIDKYVEGISGEHTKGYDHVPAALDKAPGFAARIQAYLEATKDLPNPPRIIAVLPHDYEAAEMAQAIAYYVPEAAKLIRIDDDDGSKVEWSQGCGEGKPRIILTSFKSLSRNRDNSVYPPKEFGLFLLAKDGGLDSDEVSKSIGKFTEAIQYAAVDTPNRISSRRMPHWYYQLSLDEAVKRGDTTREKSALPPITIKKNMTSITKCIGTQGKRGKPFQQFWQWLESKENCPQSGEVKTIMLKDGKSIRTELVTHFPATSLHIHCTSEAIDAILNHLDVPRKIDASVITETVLRRIIPRAKKGQTYGKNFDEFMTWLESPMNCPVGREIKTIALKDGRTIQIELRRSGNCIVLTFHFKAETLDVIANHLDIPKEIDPSVNTKDVLRGKIPWASSVYAKEFNEFWAWLELPENRPQGREGKTIILKDGRTIQTELRTAGPKTPLTVYPTPEALDAIANHLDIPKEIDPSVNTKDVLRGKIPYVSKNSLYAKEFNEFWAWLELPENSPQGREEKTIILKDGRTIQTELRRARTNTILTVHPSEAAFDAIANHLNIPKEIDANVCVKDALRNKLPRISRGSFYGKKLDELWIWLESPGNCPIGREIKTIILKNGRAIQTEIRMVPYAGPKLTIHPTAEAAAAIANYLGIPVDSKELPQANQVSQITEQTLPAEYIDTNASLQSKRPPQPRGSYMESAERITTGRDGFTR